MHAKGVAFLAREMLISRERGPDQWRAFLIDPQKADPFWLQPVLPVTRIPIAIFLRALDALTKRFYPGDAEIHWKYGVTAARQAMTDGQLKGLFSPGEERKLLAFAPTIYKSYFDGGTLTVTNSSATEIDMRITGTPVHPYFEGAVVGFASGGIELLKAATPVPKRLKGFATGDNEILYRFTVAPL